MTGVQKTTVIGSAQQPWIRRLLVLAVLICLVGLGTAGRAAAASAPAWSIRAESLPTNFGPGDTSTFDPSIRRGYIYDQYLVIATNVGGAPTSGPVTMTDILPAGLSLSSSGAGGGDMASGGPYGDFYGVSGSLTCSSAGQVVTCTLPGDVQVQPGQLVQMNIPVDVSASLAGSSVTDQFSVAGGGPPASGTVQTTISQLTPSFAFLPGQEGASESITNADGSTDTQAGSTPYQMTVGLGFPSFDPPNDYGELEPAGTVKDIVANLPAGLVVNPAAVPQCTEAQLESDSYSSGCPDDTQIGLVTLTVGLQDSPLTQVSPLFNMVPPAGVPAELGFDAANYNIYVHLMGSVRTGSDYGLSTTSSDILGAHPILGVQVSLWGNPTDPSHDPMLGSCIPFYGPQQSQPCSVPASPTPFLRLPSACSGPLTFSASADSWENPGDYVDDSVQTSDGSGDPVGITGCDQLPFNPGLSVKPTVTTADSPTGLNVDLSVPQDQNSSDLATANLKDATVTLPAGASINPSSADGLQACTPAQIGLDNASEPSCPDASKIGSVEVDTPLLSDPMKGGVYVAQEHNNPFGSIFAIYVTAEADGALIKLAGQVSPDPLTGQLVTTFDDNPQLPFSDFKLDFFNGPRAALATPAQCGSYTTSSSLSPWSGTPAVGPSDSFDVSSGCATQFKPSFVAGTTSNQAGHYGPFELSFARQDDDQFFSGLSVKLPDGLVAKLAGVPECTGAEIAAAQASTGAAEQASPSCPSDSQVGTVETWAGAGSDPFSLPGKVYLTGPYKGAPYGLAVIVPAVAGPFDLGTVVVRQALDVNPTTAQVTAVSDPLPTIVDGVPLRVRQINVDLNRSDFTLNPTSCDPMSVTGTFTSTGGMSSTLSSRYQAANCSSLGFAPKLTIGLTGKGQTKSGDHPTLNATVTQPAGQANISHVKVTLPLNFALDPNNSQVVCPYSIASKVTTGPANCPASTQVGTATAVTPLLSQPLTGPVYLVQGLSFAGGVETHTLPTLLIPLRGQIALDLRAQTSVSHGKLVTTFPTIPDAAVSKFTMTINGGKKGILVITGRGRSICDGPQVTNAVLAAQSGKQKTSNIKMATPCRAVHHHKKKHHKKHSARHGRRRSG